MVGFIHNLPEVTGQTFTLQNHQVQCFFAEQEKHYNFEKSKEITNGKVKWNKVIEHHEIKADSLAEVHPAKKEANLSKKHNKKPSGKKNV